MFDVPSVIENAIVFFLYLPPLSRQIIAIADGGSASWHIKYPALGCANPSNLFLNDNRAQVSSATPLTFFRD
jgi:hypothetical protein